MCVHGVRRVRRAAASAPIATATRPSIIKVVLSAARKVRAVTDRAAS